MSKSPKYEPPCTATPAIERLIGEVSQLVGRISGDEDTEQDLLLRRSHRIRTIHGSLAIEGNSLSEKQITAILEGKRVVAPPREILEVRNAIKVYDLMEKWNPRDESDLLAAHKIMLSGLVESPGHYRSGGVGVVGEEGIIHVAPPAKRVPILMGDLFSWLHREDRHPLVSSSIFHYEFEFIHPFDDGNGRLGRLWQTLLLKNWNPIFAITPVESMVYARQREYYDAIGLSTEQTDSFPFVEFMLSIILEAVEYMATPQVTPQVAPQVSPRVIQLLKAINNDMTRQELQAAIGLQDRKSFRKLYIRPALAMALIEMTIPDKPNSRLQKYRLTAKGRAIK